MRTWILRSIVFVLAALALTLFLGACTTYAPSTASIAFVVGNGSSGRDTRLHNIIYPGQKIQVDTAYETVSYVPANSRNYIINDGKTKSANKDVVGDRDTLIMANTKTGTRITIAAKAFWTLNQSKAALAYFYNVCFKYQCASTKDVGGDANYSTKGWNGMLAENFGPAMDGAAFKAAIKFDDSIWQKPDDVQYEALADEMSKNFANVVRAYLGYPEDLFCGSGNSVWSDPNRPGDGAFECTPVRFIVDDVQRGQVTANESTQSVKIINAQALENAQARYGPDAGYWLGLQDTIEKCKTALVNCIVNIGGSAGGPAVSVPANNPAPMPTPTPAKR